ncbi:MULTISPECIES: GntR family transcriptional regulator [unclassified Nocardioides]|uniref:GntR family transcriptional regulator n=1 Tax=unclassified Nocardioides TaxID=2615069 RepID=UPI0013FDE447|nr:MULTISPECIES: GntR family transcriptional regulator [unclassified Nocardioides]
MSDERLAQQPPLRDQVRLRLEALIIDGTYDAGAHLVETDIAARLGVSRGPIREALYHLSLHGWVDLRPRQGAFVHRPSVDEAQQFFHVRELLECDAAFLAAQHSDPLVIDEMRREIKAARASLKAGAQRELVESNASFHRLVYELADNLILKDLTSQLTKKLSWYFWPMAMERPREAWNEHEALVNAFEAGDAHQAMEIMRAHVRATQDCYFRWNNLVDPAASVRA